MPRFNSFSQSTAPILLGEQTVRFSPEDIAYVEKHGYFPEARDGRGDYIHMQFVLSNGATTASFKEDRMEHNPKFYDNCKLYYDGNTEGDGFLMRMTFNEIRKRDERYTNMTAEDILGDLLYKEFPVWFYRYESKGKGYLQVAWNEAQYKKLTGEKDEKKPAEQTKKPKEVTEEEELPFDI